MLEQSVTACIPLLTYSDWTEEANVLLNGVYPYQNTIQHTQFTKKHIRTNPNRSKLTLIKKDGKITDFYSSSNSHLQELLIHLYV